MYKYLFIEEGKDGVGPVRKRTTSYSILVRSVSDFDVDNTLTEGAPKPSPPPRRHTLDNRIGTVDMNQFLL